MKVISKRHAFWQQVNMKYRSMANIVLKYLKKKRETQGTTCQLDSLRCVEMSCQSRCLFNCSFNSSGWFGESMFSSAVLPRNTVWLSQTFSRHIGKMMQMRYRIFYNLISSLLFENTSNQTPNGRHGSFLHRNSRGGRLKNVARLPSLSIYHLEASHLEMGSSFLIF